MGVFSKGRTFFSQRGGLKRYSTEAAGVRGDRGQSQRHYYIATSSDTLQSDHGATSHHAKSTGDKGATRGHRATDRSGI